MYAAHILADSLSPEGHRLTTFEITYPRFVHDEILTYRMLSRNTSSSRAVPVEKVIDQVITDPVMPVYWGQNQRGMVAEHELDAEAIAESIKDWLGGRDCIVSRAQRLLKRKTHKQLVNRLLMSWCWITTIVSATEWQNFFAQRTAPDAQPEMREIALMMVKAYYFGNPPNQLQAGQWHLPLVDAAEKLTIPLADQIKLSVARCAAVSYLRQHDDRSLDEWRGVYDKLRAAGHMSPFEHAARASAGLQWAQTNGRFYDNYRGFQSERWMMGGGLRTFSIDDARAVLAASPSLGITSAAS